MFVPYAPNDQVLSESRNSVVQEEEEVSLGHILKMSESQLKNCLFKMANPGAN